MEYPRLCLAETEIHRYVARCVGPVEPTAPGPAMILLNITLFDIILISFTFSGYQMIDIYIYIFTVYFI